MFSASRVDLIITVTPQHTSLIEVRTELLRMRASLAGQSQMCELFRGGVMNEWSRLGRGRRAKEKRILCRSKSEFLTKQALFVFGSRSPTWIH